MHPYTISGCLLLNLDLKAPVQAGKEYGWWQIFLMAFSNTLREGLESVVFLTGVTAGTDIRSIPIAGIVGILIGITVGVALYYTCEPFIPIFTSMQQVHVSPVDLHALISPETLLTDSCMYDMTGGIALGGSCLLACFCAGASQSAILAGSWS